MRFTFFVNQAHIFCDTDYESKGVGGAEGAFILLTRELAKRGHVVEVFSKNPEEGTFSNVTYRRIENVSLKDGFDVVILFRATFYGFAAVKARKRMFWSTDLDWADWDRWVFPFADIVICMSSFHREFLLKTYERLKPDKTFTLGLGIDEMEYFPTGLEVNVVKPGNQMVFCSVPERGLKFMPSLFLAIQREVPNAQLHITSDYSLWGRSAGTENYRLSFADMAGVFYHGKLPRRNLIEIQRASKLMVYPCIYPEGFCISALECISSGAVPVCTDDFALSSTVGNAGILIEGKPGTKNYDSEFVAAAVRLLKNEQERAAIANAGRAKAYHNCTWRILADHLIHISDQSAR
jgi:glycosyltransferase involved in cell wall biosynthesis